MSKRKISLAALAVVVIVLLVLASFWYSGKIAQRGIDGVYAHFQKSTPSFEIVSRDYQRGFFSSHEKAVFKISPQWLKSMRELSCARGSEGCDISPSDLTVTAESNIEHGPFLGSHGFGAGYANIHLTFSDDVATGLAQLFGNQTPLTLDAKVGFSGSTELDAQSPAFTKNSDGMDLKWGGAKLEMDAASRFQTMHTSVAIPAIAFSDEKSGDLFTLKIQNLKGKGDFEKLYGDLFPMRYEFHMNSLDAGNREFTLHVKDIEKSLKTSTNDESEGNKKFLDFKSKAEASEISANKIHVTDFRFNGELNHIDAKAAADIRDVFSDLYRHPEETNNAGWSDETLFKLQKALSKLLRNKPEVKIDSLSFQSKDGEIEMSGEANLSKKLSNLETANPFLLLNKIQAKGKISLPEGFIQHSIGASADSWVKNGFFIRKGDKLEADFLLSGGKLTVNKVRVF